MAAAEERRSRLLVKVSRLYYVDGLNQQQIAEKLSISRPQVSRLLAAARDTGTVEIRIHSPTPEPDELATALESRFGLREAFVLRLSGDGSPSLPTIARGAADLIDEMLPEGATVAVAAGWTLGAVAQALEHPKVRSVTFVPMIGGQGPVGATWQANEIARLLATAFHGQYFLLNAPAVVANSDSRRAFLGEPEIARVLEQAAASQIALLGVGAISIRSTTARWGGLRDEEVRMLSEAGAAGNIGTGFFSLDGRILETPLGDRFVGLDLRQVKAIPLRIGVAAGREKAAALLGALRGAFLTTLVTDADTARAILALSQPDSPAGASHPNRRK